MKKVYLAMDVGGTFIKSAIVSHDYMALSDVSTYSIDSRGSREEILTAFRQVANNGVENVEGFNATLAGISVAMCGPMDYPSGVSLMQEDKYVSIYGVDLKAELYKAISADEGLPLNFVHDVQAFIKGQSLLQPHLKKGRVMAVTLGTGVGSAFMIDGRIVTAGEGIPQKGIGRFPFRNGKFEDYIGAKGLLAEFNRRSKGKPVGSVKAVAELAKSGNKEAQALFTEMGETLSLTVIPSIETFKPQTLVLGGQISRSADLFSPPLERGIQRFLSQQSIVCAINLESSALLGAVAIMTSN